MNGILDRVARSSLDSSYSQFQPKSQMEFFALRLAQKLGEPAAAKHYAELADQYSEVSCLTAFRRAKKNTSRMELPRNFHVELERLHAKSANGLSHRRLAAIRVDRRSVAVAPLFGDHLEYTPLLHQLPTANDKSVSSITTFIRWILERCPVETAALETVPDSKDFQRTQLTEAVSGVLVSQGISIWQVPKTEILNAFGHPPLRTRQQVREIISNIWPGVDGDLSAPLIRDALALGLYCQTEYLFNL